MKLIIAGGRNFDDYPLLKQKLDAILRKVDEPIIILSGRCNSGTKTFTTDGGINVCGADGLGERYAKEYNYQVEPHPANWVKFGKSAGPTRNYEMAEIATHAVLFWDGMSTGTGSMKKYAEWKGVKVRIVNIPFIK